MGVDLLAGSTGPASPRVPAAAVGRLRLTRELDRVPPGGIALVVAPAGSGKSVLLGQWVGSLVTPACRVQITPGHDDPVILARELIAAIELAAPGFDSRVSDSVTAGGPNLGAVFMSRLLVGLEDLAGDLVLVLDDVHRLRNAAIWADLDQLAERLPANVRLVLSARWDPPLHLQRLRLTTQLIDIRADDLAFHTEEGGALLTAVSGTALTPSQIEALVDRTDGWAAGLQLAAISLQGSVDPDAFIVGFSGTDRLVADYLAEEVIDDLEPDIRRFLLDTSVLEWLSPEVCDAVTGESNAQEMLDAFHPINLGYGAGRTRVHFEHENDVILDRELDVHQADDLQCFGHRHGLPPQFVLQRLATG